MRSFLPYLLFSFLLSILASQSKTIQCSGTVLDAATRQPIQEVNVFTDVSGTVTDSSGRFSLEVPVRGAFTVSHIGYETTIVAASPSTLTVLLQPKAIQIPALEISATRIVPGITPVSHSRLTEDEISRHYSAEDVPMILRSEPGVYAYSESGNGTGYSYVSIRGFDQSRIAVMIDDVPLNDNESHQVYWVDHGDILADADEVVIQRGVGNSLYGAASFGGSINVQTRIASDEEQLAISVLGGSYNTQKANIRYQTGKRLGEDLSASFRVSNVTSDGYREYSDSRQTAFSAGIEANSGAFRNQFRMLIGKERSHLIWDGISREMADDRDLRTEKMLWSIPFVDDFLQQIYSFNSAFFLSENTMLRNVAYLVTGSGYYGSPDYCYYDVNDSHAGFQAFRDTSLAQLNLDFYYPDTPTQDSDLIEFNKRRWIRNHYYGIVPTLSHTGQNWRIDAGLEMRQYEGQHFGELHQLDHPEFDEIIPDIYRYYSYSGRKTSQTAFIHNVLTHGKFTATADLQYQRHDWNLIQDQIGNFSGYNIEADWDFFNPRIGLYYRHTPDLNFYSSYGIAQKEPSDGQILKADKLFETPNNAAPEKIDDFELGFSMDRQLWMVACNFYYIRYENEIMSNIYNFEESDFDIESADRTLHTGLEMEASWSMSDQLNFSLNCSKSNNTYTEGDHKDNVLPVVPDLLVNLTAGYQPASYMDFTVAVQHTGKQYLDADNTDYAAIDAYTVVNLAAQYRLGSATLQLKANNIFDTLYETYGYLWGDGYYWPGATRNVYFGIDYRL